MQFNLYYRFLLNYINKKIPYSQYQILKLGNFFICSRNTDFAKNQNTVFTSGTCGISQMLACAKIKAISEFIEREAWKDRENNVVSRSGFAAYPFIFNRKKALINAKKFAYHEMVERYSLHMWVENNIKYLKSSKPEKCNQKLYSAIQKEITFLDYYKIIPYFENAENMVSVILYAKTKYGWAFGSAAAECIKKAEQNALKELYMHCIALYRIHKHQITVQSNFEKQLLWISQQEKFIQEKINASGNNYIQIPNAQYRNLKTKYDDCYVVIQCYFEEYQKCSSDNNIKKMYL